MSPADVTSAKEMRRSDGSLLAGQILAVLRQIAGNNALTCK